MKIGYEKPMIEFEEYELNVAVATGCDTTVDLAPEEWYYNGQYHEICDEYIQDLDVDGSKENSGCWFEGSCSCYLSSGNTTLLTS